MSYNAALITSAQNFTTSWVDLGSEITTAGYNYLILWLQIDINNTNNPRVRFLSKHTSAGSDEYSDAVYNTVTSSTPYHEKVEQKYIEFNVDEDVRYRLIYNLYNRTDYVQVQIQCGTVGATAGQIDSAYYSLAY